MAHARARGAELLQGSASKAGAFLSLLCLSYTWWRSATVFPPLSSFEILELRHRHITVSAAKSNPVVSSDSATMATIATQTAGIQPAPALTVTSRQRDPSVFAGVGDDDVSDWIDSFERASRHNRWDDHLKLSNVIFYLTNVARTWFINHELEFDTWTTFKTRMLEVHHRPAAFANNRPVCYYCGIPGHVQRNCRRRRQEQAPSDHFTSSHWAPRRTFHSRPELRSPSPGLDERPQPNTSRPTTRRSPSPRGRSLSPMIPAHNGDPRRSGGNW